MQCPEIGERRTRGHRERSVPKAKFPAKSFFHNFSFYTAICGA